MKNSIIPSAAHARQFRKCWSAEIQKQARLVRNNSAPEISAWEAYEACQELIERDTLWLVLPNGPTQNSLFRLLTDRLSRETYLYKTFCNFIVPASLYFKDAISALASAKSKLGKPTLKESLIKRQLEMDLKNCSALLEKTLDTLKTGRQSFWQDVLFASAKERSRWSICINDDKEVRSIPPPELAEFEQIFDKVTYPTALAKRIDLDKRFQIRVAVILRRYLSGEFRISLRTISRLVALTYLAGGLGREQDDRLLVEGRKRPITVGGIDQKIRPCLQ